MPHDEWDAYSGWGEEEFDPLGPDEPDDYLSEADE